MDNINTIVRSSRTRNWQKRLNDHIRAHESVCHSYDPTEGLDCGRWAASCVELVSGRVFLEDAKWKTEKGALLYIARKKCESVDQLAEKFLGMRQPISFAAPGDIVAADLVKLGLAGGLPQIGFTLGVCNGSVSYFVGETGQIRIPTLSLECAFYG